MGMKPWVMVGSDHGPMIINRLDAHVMADGKAYGVGFQIMQNGVYDPDDVKMIREILVDLVYKKPGLTILDCGANIGVHTVEMGRILQNGLGQVFAFEAQEQVFYALCGNVVLNNLSNVQAMRAAVGDHVGFLDIPKVDYNAPGSFGSLEYKWRPGKVEYIGQNVSYNDKDLVRVPLLSIDSLELKRWDFAKIDVEGMELEVLAGGINSIRQFHPTLLIEWIKCGKEPIVRLLGSMGYRIEDRGMNVLATFNNGE